MQFLLGDLKYEDNFCRHFWSRPGSGIKMRHLQAGRKGYVPLRNRTCHPGGVACLFLHSRQSVSSSKEGIAMWAACWKQEAKEERSLRDFESELGLDNMLTLTQLNDL